MKGKATLLNHMYDRFSRATLVQLCIPGDVTEELQELTGKQVALSLSKHREKRSLTANSYYWELIGKMAQVLKISSTSCHNMMLRRYGTLLTDEYGNTWDVRVPNADDSKVLENDLTHLYPTSKMSIGEDGVLYTHYRVIKGSSLYDTAEMSRLIDGTVSEAKEMGIETLPPEELERLKQLIKEKTK